MGFAGSRECHGWFATLVVSLGEIAKGSPGGLKDTLTGKTGETASEYLKELNNKVGALKLPTQTGSNKAEK